MAKGTSQRLRARRAVVLLGACTLFLAMILVLVPRHFAKGDPDLPSTATADPIGVGEAAAVAEDTAEAEEPAEHIAAEEVAVASSRPTAPPEPTSRSLIVVILDDAGQNLADTLAFLDFPGFFYVSVLPRLPHSRESARLAAEAGKGVMLHCPMEPVAALDPGPGAILTSTQSTEVRAVFSENLRSVGGVAAVNNHMGSKATADRRLMAEIMSLLSEAGIAFVDSRTTPDSVVLEAAEDAGVVAYERDVFLDNERDAKSIRAALEEGLAVARRQGYAILIGHVQSRQLAAVLMEEYDRIVDAGYAFASLDDLPGKMEKAQ